ncbi:hypothetical protein [Loktanella sp. SALINAS62]|uniref:hypothetical protein n=1 Tax=Loktanella sp. SALINAS62 TaxID=2706124 RepID=UPI001B8CD1D6|nr:hypothetical protein [Loktanella sp. SALINAS62]MBS1303267.1 hypothetical protein [Loktanella sp. SALINAS62]
MRLFARTPMTGAALRIANTLAGYISYDGKFRGAPCGFAAFTMKELQTITGISDRSIRSALDELAHLFGLTIERRHHDRHLFTFSKVHGADVNAVRGEGLSPAENADISYEKRVTGSPPPPSLYTRTKSNNDTPSSIQILDWAGSVYQTPFAAIIEDAKKGTEAAGMDTQFLWKGFHMLNVRHDRAIAPLSWLVAFVRKAKPTFQHKPKAPVPAAPPTACTDPVQLMARPAPFANRAFHESDLRRAIGPDAYEQRVAAIQSTYNAPRFAAQLAVHGQAVREGTIDR